MAHLVRARLLFFLCVGLIVVSIFPAEAQAGPYYRLNPHKFSFQLGPSFDTSPAGGLVGGAMQLDYRVAHVNERMSVRLGVRGHGTIGPVIQSSSRELYHGGGFASVKLEAQIDSAQGVWPYIVVAPGFLAYNGHPNSQGGAPDGMGVALEAGTGVLVQKKSDVFGFYAELNMVLGAPHAAYMRASAGLQVHFGSVRTDVKAF